MKLKPGMLPEKLAVIKAQRLYGAITEDEAELAAQPILDDMNAKGRAIAKKYNRRFRPFTFKSVMR